MEVQMIAVIIGVVVNIALFAFTLGKWRQDQTSIRKDLEALKEAVGISEKQRAVNNKDIARERTEWERTQESRAHPMLQECSNTFSRMERGIGEIKGSLDALLAMQRNKGKQE